jgi:hypothetical protein
MYRRILYIGDHKNAIEFDKKYGHHKLLLSQGIYISSCDGNMLPHPYSGYSGDYKTNHLYWTLFVLQTNFQLSEDTQKTIDRETYPFTTVNSLIGEDQFNIKEIFSDEPIKQYSRFELLDISS